MSVNGTFQGHSVGECKDFEPRDDKEHNNLWMHTIFNRDKLIEQTEQWTKEAEEAGMTLIEYLESISPLNNKEKSSLFWKCERCGKLISYMADFCYECSNELLGEPPKPFEPK